MVIDALDGFIHENSRWWLGPMPLRSSRRGGMVGGGSRNPEKEMKLLETHHF